jgi:hypothetical protein
MRRAVAPRRRASCRRSRRRDRPGTAFAAQVLVERAERAFATASPRAVVTGALDSPLRLPSRRRFLAPPPPRGHFFSSLLTRNFAAGNSEPRV